MSNNQSEQGNLITLLTQYKEFIAILLFFVSGGIWLFSYTATKTQVNELNCVMNQNVQMLRGKMEYQFVTDMLDNNKEEISDLKRDIRLAKKINAPHERLDEQVEGLKELRAEYKKEKEKFQKKMEDALNFLSQNKCDGGK